MARHREQHREQHGEMQTHEPVPMMRTGAGLPGVLDEMDRLMERFFGRGSGLGRWPVFRWPEEMITPFPKADIYEDETQVMLKAELPGLTKDEIEVEIAADAVKLSGVKKKEETVERDNYYRSERSVGSFTRAFTLPAEIRPEEATATFSNGVLEIAMPKATETQKKVKVEIK
jgi:HSP20 family protein